MTSFRAVAWLVAGFGTAGLVILLALAGHLTEGRQLLEAEWGYTAKEALGRFATWGDVGRQAHWRLLQWDWGIPLCYGSVLAGVLVLLVSPQGSPRALWWAVLPAVAVVADYGENVTLFRALHLYPDTAPEVLEATSLLTQTKWAFTLATGAAIGSWGLWRLVGRLLVGRDSHQTGHGG